MFFDLTLAIVIKAAFIEQAFVQSTAFPAII